MAVRDKRDETAPFGEVLTGLCFTAYKDVVERLDDGTRLVGGTPVGDGSRCSALASSLGSLKVIPTLRNQPLIEVEVSAYDAGGDSDFWYAFAEAANLSGRGQ